MSYMADNDQDIMELDHTGVIILPTEIPILPI